MPAVAKKDVQTVTPDGESVKPMIDGVHIRYATTHPDERGTLCEVYNPAWNFSEEPLVYVYQVTVRPGRIKGWIKHLQQDDRLFISLGAIRIALYDDRPDSPTYKMLTVNYLSEVNRGLIRIPRGVFHALQNIGQTDALFINLPTRAYNHTDPDKYRLPLKNDVIPFDFDDVIGW